ncbi:hypothetical protein GPALN_002145 [Globodera pallida]|nr:hypothetical protein GPALN_002145 [Globodera pallida]
MIIISGDFGTKSFSLPSIDIFRGRVQEMRGLHLDLREEVAAVQWRDPFSAYDYVQHNDLSWQPTDLKLINDYGMPNQELMFPHFTMKSIGHVNFSVDIMKMYYNHNEKKAVSPLSAAIALSMAYIGARGQTAVELGKVLAAGDSSGPSLRDNYGKFLQENGSAQTDANFTLKISKKLYLADSVKVLDEFKSVIRTRFGEDSFESIDFGQQIEVADLDMMFQIGQFMYMETEDFELLGVPYVVEKAHFVIMLPKSKRHWDYVFQKFNGGNLVEFLKKSTMKELRVILPKFKIVSLHQNLEETLLLLGIKRAFRPSKADFSGINHTLYINKVIQKAHFSIDEDGTATSPSTAADSKSIGSFFGLPQLSLAPTFQADHSFAFFVTLQKKHVIFSGIFIGE